ncbi:MAG: hypothetical protein HC905_04985 [Bacteroidales bacterium]|nr:hypothetical protein [Bacteroidales bacterium]
MSSINAQEERKLIRQGNKDYKADKFTEAEESYRKALEKSHNRSKPITTLAMCFTNKTNIWMQLPNTVP